MKAKEGSIYKMGKDDRVRAEYTNTKTGEHHCMPFASEEGAVAWLTSKGILYKDIEQVEEDDLKPGMPQEIENVMSKAFKSMDHTLNAVAQVRNHSPKAGYAEDDLAQFQEDAVTNMVILAKCGVPVHPEDLEDWVRSYLAGKGVKS